MVRLSIIVPIYNCEQYLTRCIESLLRQEIEDMEIILVDDGSKDSSGTICDSYAEKDDRIHVIHKENGGLGAARNTGLENAKGKYIGFVDSDDWVVDDMYIHLINLAEKYNAEICAGSIYLTSDENKLIKDKGDYQISIYEGSQKIEKYLEIGIKYRASQYPVWNKIYVRELFDNIRFPEKQLYEDMATNYKLLLIANRFVISSKQVYYYFQKGASITRNKCSIRDLDLIKVTRQIKRMSKGKNEIIKDYANVIAARAYFSILFKAYMYGVNENVINKEKYIKFISEELKDNYKILIKSSIPLSRKISLILMVKFPTVFKFLIKLYVKLKI